MHILKEVSYVTTQITAIHFFYGSVIISREHLKQPICQRRVNFITLAIAISYNKRSVLNSRKFEVYVYLRKAIVSLIF